MNRTDKKKCKDTLKDTERHLGEREKYERKNGWNKGRRLSNNLRASQTDALFV